MMTEAMRTGLLTYKITELCLENCTRTVARLSETNDLILSANNEKPTLIHDDRFAFSRECCKTLMDTVLQYHY